MSKLRLGSVALVLVSFGGACFTGSTTTAKPPIANTGTAVVAAAPTGIVISATAIGLVDASTPATLEGLREKLVGYEVKASNDGVNGSVGFLHFDVFKDGERMFYVVQDDDGRVFNVHATSPKITIDSHPSWKIGAPFSDAKQLTECDCWGTAIVCWKGGETVAAAFDRTCSGMVGKTNAVALKVLDGVNLQRVVWAPKPFVGDEDATPSIDMKRPGGGGLGGHVKGIPTRPPMPDPDPCDGGGDPCD